MPTGRHRIRGPWTADGAAKPSPVLIVTAFHPPLLAAPDPPSAECGGGGALELFEESRKGALPREPARVLRDYERHWSRGDAEGLAALFVEDGLIARGGTWIGGRDAIREAYRNASGPLRLRAIEFASRGRVGYIVGAYGYGESLPVEDMGLFTLTLRRDASGRWLIVSDLDRSGG